MKNVAPNFANIANVNGPDATWLRKARLLHTLGQTYLAYVFMRLSAHFKAFHCKTLQILGLIVCKS